MTKNIIEPKTVKQAMDDPVTRAVEMSAARTTNQAGSLLFEALQTSPM